MELTLPAHREELRNGATLEPVAAKRGTYEIQIPAKAVKPFCALYAKGKDSGIYGILGKDERAKLKFSGDSFQNEVQMIYDAATTFHDGQMESCLN